MDDPFELSSKIHDLTCISIPVDQIMNAPLVQVQSLGTLFTKLNSLYKIKSQYQSYVQAKIDKLENDQFLLALNKINVLRDQEEQLELNKMVKYMVEIVKQLGNYSQEDVAIMLPSKVRDK